MVMNYKQIPYHTVYIHLHEIQERLPELNIPPSGKLPSGKNHWTVPSISDPNQSSDRPMLVTDSTHIARYLDKAYPHNRLFPPQPLETHHDALLDQLERNMVPIVAKLTIPSSPNLFEEVDARCYEQRASPAFGGVPLKDLYREPEARRAVWQETKEGWNKLAEFVDETRKSAGLDPSAGPFVFRKTPCYADLILIAMCMFFKISPLDRDEGIEHPWEMLKDWNNGRWERMVDTFEEYTVLRDDAV
jgi:glutathione S-transferase